MPFITEGLAKQIQERPRQGQAEQLKEGSAGINFTRPGALGALER